MANRHISGTANALYRVFVLPASRAPPSRPLLPSPTTPIIRVFSQTPHRRLREARPPEVRTQKWDEEITSNWVHLVDHTGKIIGEPQQLTRILSTLDRKTERVVQLAAGEGADTPDGLPICRVRNKEDMHKQEMMQKQRQKEQKRISKLTNMPKSLELNWAIGENDLGHRMDKLTGFLKEGRRVEIILAAKKRGRKASGAECEALMETITNVVDAVPGATFMGKMEGSYGAFSVLKVQGKMPELAKAAAQAPEEETEEAAKDG